MNKPNNKASAKPRKLSIEEQNAFGAELDAIRQRHSNELGERDANYIKRIVRIQRSLAIGSRLTIYASLPLLAFGPIPFLTVIAAGSLGLGIAKILDNMEIGHNIMHGQYDWMNDPKLNSKNFDWDTTCPADQWKHSHNYQHHTFTNILDKDRDIGYGTLRMADEQPWHPRYLGNPLYATLLMLNFDMGVALHDLEVERIQSGKKTWKEALPTLRGVAKKTSKIWAKDYLLFPLLAGPFFLHVAAANLVANVIRNIWTFTIIFCGHFPDGVQVFTEDECENESRGHWYYRQLLGSANLTGGKFFHVMSGNLSHQIEHHLFPDIPAHRYAEMSVEVQEICQRYGLPYNKGPLPKQFATVVRRICKLALPPRSGGNTLVAA